MHNFELILGDLMRLKPIAQKTSPIHLQRIEYQNPNEESLAFGDSSKMRKLSPAPEIIQFFL